MLASLAVILFGLGISLTFNRGKPDLGLSADEELKLHELAEMFGESKLQYSMKELILKNLQVQQTQIVVAQDLELINDAIATVGIDTDFSAPPPPTGDELFDAYATAVDERIYAYRPRSDDEFVVSECAILPDRVLDRWEGRFGDDPRYWELRYLMRSEAGGDAPVNPLADGQEPAASMVYLEQARSRGIATANTLLLLYEETVKANEAALDELADYEGAENAIVPSTTIELDESPAFTDEQLAEIVVLQHEQEAAELALLDEAVAAGPDEAWPYYMRALWYLSRGEYDLGLADLKAGNAAPVNVYPRPFPVTLIGDSLGTDQPAGGPVFCGTFQMAMVSYSMPNYIKFKERFKDADVMVKLGADLELLDALHGFACRFGDSIPNSVIQHLVGIVQVAMVRTILLETNGGELSPAQRETLDRLNGAIDMLRIKARMVNREYDYMQVFPVASLAGGPRGFPLAYYLQDALDAKHIAEEISPIMADLTEVHYPLLCMPESLLKYEVLPNELRDARRSSQRAAQGIEEVVERSCAKVRGQQVIDGLDKDGE